MNLSYEPATNAIILGASLVEVLEEMEWEGF